MEVRSTASIISRVEDQIRSSQISLRAAALQIGISPATLIRILQGVQGPNRETMSAFARWVGEPMSEDAGVVSAHLRAEKNLHPEVCGALTRMFRLIEGQTW